MKWPWVTGMSQEDVELLRSLPFSLQIPSHGVVIVHAGLVPGVHLEHQNLTDLFKVKCLTRAPKLKLQLNMAHEIWHPTAVTVLRVLTVLRVS